MENTFLVKRKYLDYVISMVWIIFLAIQIPWVELSNFDFVDIFNGIALLFFIIILIRTIQRNIYLEVTDDTMKINRLFNTEVVEFKKMAKFYDNPYLGNSYFINQDGKKVGKIEEWSIGKKAYGRILKLLTEKGIGVF